LGGPQGSITESLRVALTSFCKGDNFLGHSLAGWTGGAVSALERHQSHLVCNAHDPDRLGVEPLAIKVKSYRHMRLPVTGGSVTELSATGAWGKSRCR